MVFSYKLLDIRCAETFLRYSQVCMKFIRNIAFETELGHVSNPCLLISRAVGFKHGEITLDSASVHIFISLYYQLQIYGFRSLASIHGASF